jgi:hypothetical protein
MDYSQAQLVKMGGNAATETFDCGDPDLNTNYIDT